MAGVCVAGPGRVVVTRSCGPTPGLDALQAAVAGERQEERARAARAGRVSSDLLEAGRPPAGRISSRGRLAPGSIPSPSPASDRSEAPAPDVDADTSGASAAPESVPLTEQGEQSLALVRRAQAGDVEAFGQLYDRYLDMVYRYIHYRVASPQLAEDLASETFLRALRRIGTFHWQGRDIGAWFVTIARNLVADHYKSARYRLELTTDDVGRSGPVPLEDGPEGVVLEGLQNAVLLDAVRRLGAEQQECIVLRFLQGLSVAETARIMGKNDGAIKALQHRAVRALGRLLPEGTEL